MKHDPKQFWNVLCAIKDGAMRDFGDDPNVVMGCGVLTALIAAHQRNDLRFASEKFCGVIQELKKRHPEHGQN